MPLHQLVENAIKEGEKMIPGLTLRAWAKMNTAKLNSFPAKAETISANASKVNAVLLGYLAWGRRTDAILNTFKNTIKSWSIKELENELKAYFAISQMPRSGVILMPSFRHANQMETVSAKNTLDKAKQCMMKAYLSSSAAGRNAGTGRSQMETWFGSYNATRFSEVTRKLKMLSDVLGAKPICVYYRGSKIKGPSDKPNENTNASKTTAFASAFKHTSLPAVYDRSYAHVTLGEKFFNYKTQKTGVANGLQARVAMFGGAKAGLKRPGATYASTGGSDSIAGVLVHELSHNVCDTDDVTLPPESPNSGKDCYGKTNCQWLAENRPADAINNADNFEYYFEEFQ